MPLPSAILVGGALLLGGWLVQSRALLMGGLALTVLGIGVGLSTRSVESSRTSRLGQGSVTT